MMRFGFVCVLLFVLVAMAWGHSGNLNNFIGVFVDIDGQALDGTYCGRMVTNVGASGSQTFTLPANASGMHMRFCCAVAQNIVIDPAAGDQIVSLTTSPGDSITAGAIGSSIELVGVNDSTWIAVSIVGAWADTD